MTSPRQVLPGKTYLVTRRCFQRQFLLRPSAITNTVFGYLLAVAAQRFGVQLHAYCVLSNHYHLVLTDPSARLPAFSQLLDALVARVLNAAHGRWETFWAPSTYSAVVLGTPEAVVDSAAYTLANPVAAGLVRDAKAWPGLWSDPEDFDGPARVLPRPEIFFAKDGSMPEQAPLGLSLPPQFGTAEEFRRLVRDRLSQRVQEAVKATEAAGRTFLGERRLLAQKHWQRPSAPEQRRGLRPRVATRDKWRRIELLNRIRDFSSRYRKAWLAFRAGVRDVVFPAGTYRLRLEMNVLCDETG